MKALISIPTSRPSQAVVRAGYAAFAHAAGHRAGEDVESTCRNWFPDDLAALAVVRAAVASASTATSGWASQIIGESMLGFYESLLPYSAAAALRSRGGGLSIDLSRRAPAA